MQITLSVLTLVLANLAFLVLYFVFDLTLFQLAAVYWWECLWIGLFSGLKLVTASLFGDPYENRWVEFSHGANVLTSVVAIVFVAGEFLAIFAILGFAILFAFHALTGIDQGELMRDALGPVLGSSVLFLVGHGLSFVANFLVGGEFRTARAVTLLTLPFTRCLALIGAVVVAFTVAFLLPGFANTAGFVTILVLLKLGWDYLLHKRERRAFAASPE